MGVHFEPPAACQYLYFCTSKASKLRTCAGEEGWELVSPAVVSQDAGGCGQLVTVERAGPQFTCFTSTEVQILTRSWWREVKAVLLTRVSPVYLLY